MKTENIYEMLHERTHCTSAMINHVCNNMYHVARAPGELAEIAVWQIII